MAIPSSVFSVDYIVSESNFLPAICSDRVFICFVKEGTVEALNLINKITWKKIN